MNKIINIVERIIKPAVFCYDFKHTRAGLSYVASRAWVFFWLLLDVVAQLVLESGTGQSTNSWIEVGMWLGTAGTFVLLWKLPPILGATLAGMGMFRAILSLFVVFGAYPASMLPYAPILLLVVQVWMLSAYCVLILRYIRTPKKDIPAVLWPDRMCGAGGTVTRPWWG